ncbi:unnamed protein product, partial [marine sediment metagenome]
MDYTASTNRSDMAGMRWYTEELLSILPPKLTDHIGAAEARHKEELRSLVEPLELGLEFA